MESLVYSEGPIHTIINEPYCYCPFPLVLNVSQKGLLGPSSLILLFCRWEREMVTDVTGEPGREPWVPVAACALLCPPRGSFSCTSRVIPGLHSQHLIAYCNLISTMIWIFVFPPNSYVEILNPKVMALGAGALEVFRSWGWSPPDWNQCPHERPEKASSSLPPGEGTQEVSDLGGVGSQQNPTTLALRSSTSSLQNCQQ